MRFGANDEPQRIGMEDQSGTPSPLQHRNATIAHIQTYVLLSNQMTLYHLSKNKDLDRIVDSSRSELPNAISPRVPRKCLAEDQRTKRVCVAPTIWQCLMSMPDADWIYVYRIDEEVASAPLGNIGDSSLTQEKWVTDEDISRAGGEIPLVYRGRVNKTRLLRESLNVASRMGKLPTCSVEEQSVWIELDGEFRLQDEFQCR
ncbi:hypothetical protein K227x_37360 [Rubripirellula lacrimiformis]|uniref:Uncharacterized protein n=1 Tax=Rubripirellula lacrimiformis TaxID=1930273 RepID=A0A517NDX9_9BACT|nr:hypothetical protein K227x_37360 [Rubripirellula lacrimiformis]